MGKYKLSELLNELSNAELAKLRLMQKLKSGEMSSDEFAAVGDSDDAAIAAMTADLVKKEKDLKNNFNEITQDEHNRFDGMIDQRLKRQFMEKFLDIVEDYQDTEDLAGELNIHNFITYLARELFEFSEKMHLGGKGHRPSFEE